MFDIVVPVTTRFSYTVLKSVFQNQSLFQIKAQMFLKRKFVSHKCPPKNNSRKHHYHQITACHHAKFRDIGSCLTGHKFTNCSTGLFDDIMQFNILQNNVPNFCIFALDDIR